MDRRSATSPIRPGGPAIGDHRLWRAAGFILGALLAGVIADRQGMAAAIWTVAALTGASGLVALVRMYETNPRQHRPK